MDENYLDSLLDEFSLDREIDDTIEDELDHEMAEEKKRHNEKNEVSLDDMFNMDLEQDADSSLLDADLDFSEDQIKELDELDDLADMDMDNLNFDDIDFNDLDMTKLDDVEDGNIDGLLKDFDGELQIPDSFDEQTKEEKPETAPAEETALEKDGPAAQQEVSLTENLNEDAFDTDEFLNNLLDDGDKGASEEDIPDISEPEHIAEEPKEESSGQDGTEEGQAEEEEMSLEDLLAESMQFEEDYKEELGEEQPEGQENTEEQDKGQENAEEQGAEDSEDAFPEMESLDDLFSMLDLDDPEQEGTAEETDGQDQADNGGDQEESVEDILNDIDEMEEADTPKKKKGLMEILFGEPDEDDELSEEELQAIEAKKAAKKAKKQAAKEAKAEKAEAAKAEKELKNGQKKKNNEEKKRVKAEKKAKRKAEEKANAEPEKPLNRPMVIFIFSMFLGGTALFYLASNNFDYTLAIENATKYFSRQKYHSAYDEIKGVDVREKDQELKDRIYTVMYVERLYESYLNNIEMGRQEKALDSLLRGVDKYYEHYEEAAELGITSDLDYSFNQIRTILETQYGITVEQAVAINDLEDYEYVQTIQGYVQAHPVSGTGTAGKTGETQAEAENEEPQPENEESQQDNEGQTEAQQKEEVEQ